MPRTLIASSLELGGELAQADQNLCMDTFKELSLYNTISTGAQTGPRLPITLQREEP